MDIWHNIYQYECSYSKNVVRITDLQVPQKPLDYYRWASKYPKAITVSYSNITTLIFNKQTMRYFKLLLSIDKNSVDQELIDAIYNEPNYDIEKEDNIETVKDFIVNEIIVQEMGIDVLTMTEINSDELDVELNSLLPKQLVTENEN